MHPYVGLICGLLPGLALSVFGNGLTAYFKASPAVVWHILFLMPAVLCAWWEIARLRSRVDALIELLADQLQDR